MLIVGHIREAEYPEWLANVALEPKLPTYHMCVDYMDLNKACPIDPFPLPSSGQIVDEARWCKLLSFVDIDAFKGCH